MFARTASPRPDPVADACELPCVVTGGVGFLGQTVASRFPGLGCPVVRVVDLVELPARAPVESPRCNIHSADLARTCAGWRLAWPSRSTDRAFDHALVDS